MDLIGLVSKTFNKTLDSLTFKLKEFLTKHPICSLSNLESTRRSVLT